MAKKGLTNCVERDQEILSKVSNLEKKLRAVQEGITDILGIGNQDKFLFSVEEMQELERIVSDLDDFITRVILQQDSPPSPVYEPASSPVYEPSASPVYEPATSPVYEPGMSTYVLDSLVYEPSASPIYEPATSPVYEPAASPVYEPSSVVYPPCTTGWCRHCTFPLPKYLEEYSGGAIKRRRRRTPEIQMMKRSKTTYHCSATTVG